MPPERREGTRQRADLALWVYSHLHQHGAKSFEHAAQSLHLNEDERAAAREELLRLGLITQHPGGSHVVILPESAVVKALEVGQRRLLDYREAVTTVHNTLDELVNRYMPLGTPAVDEIELRVLTDQRSIDEYLDASVSLSRDEVLTMHPGPMPPPELLMGSLDRDRNLAARGLRLRTIYSRRLSMAGYVMDHLRTLTSLGFEVRLAEILPARLLVFDRRRAVMPFDPTDIRSGAVAIESPRFVPTMVGLFDYCWQNSTRLNATNPTESPSGLTEHERAVLRMLASGLKDETIARSLGVSVRTVSRTVGELAQRLGADSRFQAGVRAAHQGWLD